MSKVSKQSFFEKKDQKTFALGACLLLPIAAQAATPPSLEARILAQQGMSIGLTTSLLQSTFDVVDNAGISPPACKQQVGGSTIETLSTTHVSSTQIKAVVGIYFDAACKQPYQRVMETVTGSAAGSITVAETVVYTGLRGQALGTLSWNAEATTPVKGTEIWIGVGTFKPASAAAPSVSLGIACTFTTIAKCQTGVAQPFPALKLSLASLTPLTVTPKKLPNGSSSLTFTGTGSTLRTGPIGSLSIIKSSATTLAIAGGGTNYATTATTGAAALFALFPPPPTTWKITDKAHAATLTLSETATKSSLFALKNTAASKQLAKGNADRSGTGAITYTDGRKSAVTNWLLAD